MMTPQFFLLGPVEGSHHGQDIELGPPQRRALLAVLLLAQQQAVTVAALRERMWGMPFPVSAISAVHVHIHHLRRLLQSYAANSETLRLVTHPGHPKENVSYVLHIDPDCLDVNRFYNWLERGEACQERGDLHGAVLAFDSALGLWRGKPLAHLRTSAYVSGIRHRLAEIRLDIRKRRAASLIDLGAAGRAVTDLKELSAEQPDDESVVILLTTALCKTGSMTRALRLVGDELDRWEREYGLHPPTLLVQRDRIVTGALGPS